MGLHPLYKIPYADVAMNTLDRHLEIEKHIKLTVIYECGIMKALKRIPELREYWNAPSMQRQFVEPITPRATLKGGRTEVFCLSLELSEEQIRQGFRIRFIDFVSLYPAVQKKCQYPKALHPKIYLSDDLKHREGRITDWSREILGKYFSMVSAMVLPPTTLYIPVLPCHIRGKCIYALCQTCAVEDHQTSKVVGCSGVGPNGLGYTCTCVLLFFSVNTMSWRGA